MEVKFFFKLWLDYLINFVPIFFIGPGKMVPFWPQFGPTCPIFVKIKGHPKTCHLSFSLNKEDSTLLMLKNQYGGIHVEVKASGLFTSLWDKAPNYLFGCVIQKRIQNIFKMNQPSTLVSFYHCSHFE